MLNKSQERYFWIDFLRGIAIFFVILGHQIPDLTYFFVFTSPIKMPLFFFISGYLFKSNIGVIAYIQKTTKRLVIPWLLLPIIPYLWSPLRIPQIILSLILGKLCWFMVCFVLCSYIVYFQHKYINNNIVRLSISFILAALGLVLTHYGVPNLCMFNTALVCQSYMNIVCFIKEKYPNFLQFNHVTTIISALLYIIVCMVGYWWYNSIIDVHLNRYYNIPLCFITILLGSYFISVVVKRFIKSNNIFSFYGKNSLLIYLWSGVFTSLCYHGLHYFNIQTDSVICRTFIAVAACTVLGIISMIIRRYCPVLIGENGTI